MTSAGEIGHQPVRESVGRLRGNGNQAVDPAGGEFVFGDDQLEGAGFPERVAIKRIGHQYFASVKTGIGFRDRQHHGVFIRDSRAVAPQAPSARATQTPVG